MNIRCTKCGNDKDIKDFYIRSESSSAKQVASDCKDCHKKQKAEWRQKNIDLVRQKSREAIRKIRREVIEHYGNLCVCCGEQQYEFLTMDHIEGGGNKHRKELKSQGLARWLRYNKFPTGFQVLCFNCNNAKHNYKVCPHKLR